MYGHKEKKQVYILKKLWLTFISFALVPIILMGICSLFVSVRVVFQNADRRLKDSVNQISMMADSKLEEMAYVSETLANNKVLKELLRNPMEKEHLYQFQMKMQEIISMTSRRDYDITVCGNHGQIYVNYETDGMIYRNSLTKRIQSKNWFSRLEEARSLPVWVADTHAEYSEEQKVVAVARNIMNDRLGEEEVLGFILVSIPSRQLSKLLMEETEECYIVDENDAIVMSRDTNQIGETLEGITNEEGKQTVDKNGAIYLAYRKENQQGNLVSISMIDRDSLVDNLYILFGANAVIILLFLGVLFWAAHKMASSLAQPIQELSEAMGHVQDETLVPVNIQTEIREIGDLVRAYHFMLERIRKLIKEKVQEEQRRKEIEIEKSQAELKFLRAQINPHFLFNTLNSIKWLARIHGDSPVEEMLVALGRLLECSMQRGNDFITLWEEIENVKAYLKIQQMRYGNKIKVEYNLQEDIRNMEVPKLIVQPLVENAIIHGIDENADGGTIFLRTWEQEGDLFVSVEDDGPGFLQEAEEIRELAPEEKKKRLGGIGIRNIDKRLWMIYGEGYGLHYENRQKGRGTKAILRLKKEEHHAESDSGR